MEKSLWEGCAVSQYFDLNKQISHLAIDKSIMFKHEELGEAEKLLRDTNYRNFVSCSKVNFAEYFEPNLVMYKTATFREWRNYFEMDCRVSQYLMKNLIKFERTINSRLSHVMSEMMENDEFSSFEKNALIQRIQAWQRGVQRLEPHEEIKDPYDGSKTWELIPKMTFGAMKQFLFWIYDKKQNKYFEIVKGYTFLEKPKKAKNKLDELNRLRNNLAHFRPLTIYLIHGSTRYKPKMRRDILDNTYRKEIVDFVFNLSPNKYTLSAKEKIFESSDNYVKIKNSQHNVG